MTKNERLMRQRGKRLMKTLKKSIYAKAASEVDKNSRANDEGETIPPYKHTPPEWYGNEDDDDTFNDDEDDNDGMD